MNKILFLDRDGVINTDYGYVNKLADFHFMPGIFKLCLAYAKMGYLIIVVTNQAGVSKGKITIENLEAIHAFLLESFKKQGINIAKIYCCLHHPDLKCSCRKPEAGLFLQALKDFNADPKASLMIGDKESDLIAAYRAGILELYYLKGRYILPEVSFNFVTINHLEELLK